MTKTRIGIVGYGNLGRGVEAAIAQNPDMELVAVFTKRDPASLQPLTGEVPVHRFDDLDQFVGLVDVLVLCGSSKGDLPEQAPGLARRFTIVDSFDTHAEIPTHFAAVDAAARAGGTTAIISSGWDPGLFSINRLVGEAVLPAGATYTFWGKGLSQGHSAALRRVPGVADAVQYTVPSPAAIERARSGKRPELAVRDQHVRECFVVLEPGADPVEVHEAIVTMPHYFEPYDTTVHFVSADDLARDHTTMPHGGFVIRSGVTGDGAEQTYEFHLGLESNPAFTASVLVAYARAAHRLFDQGAHGAHTVFDVAPALLSPKTPEELRRDLL